MQTPVIDPLSTALLACRPDGSVLGLCQRLQQMLLHYIKRYGMLESFPSLLMCAFWPQATTSHPVLSLTWQPRILGAFPKLCCISCQRCVLPELLEVVLSDLWQLEGRKLFKQTLRNMLWYRSPYRVLRANKLKRCLKCSYCMSNFWNFLFKVKALLSSMRACAADPVENLTVSDMRVQ